MTELPTITEYYKNKNIFITGGSGFIGKVLVEKLLRSCPDIKNMYLLMRPKKAKSQEARMKSITELPLFDVLKEQNPSALSKIRLISGDVGELRLGLSEDDHNFLLENVDVIFHGAASVRFDDPLTDAVLVNTRGTREILQLALNAKHLEVLVHISTTYCHTYRKVVEEKFYPAYADWEKTIEVAENVDRNVLNVLTNKYIAPLTNTYTFTKLLAEHAVHDLGDGKFPAVVFRPSIVISTAVEPIAGWIDNFNGPAGLLAACGKGVVRSVLIDPDIIADYVPVDIEVKALIIAAWKQATTRAPSERLETTFYNGSNYDVRPVTMGDIMKMGVKIFEEVPLQSSLWYPNVSTTKCYYYHFLKVVFYQLIPALFVDGLLKVSGHKPFLMRIQRRIYIANMIIEHFVRNQWEFVNHKVKSLENLVPPADVEAFFYNKDELEKYQFFLNASIGGKKYLFKEVGDWETDKKNSFRMWVAAQIFNFLWYLVLVWLIFFKIDIVSIIIGKWNQLCLYLTTE